MRISNHKSFVEKANLVHNNKFNYNKSDYLSSKTSIIITCVIHGDFQQLPAVHLRGHGCPQCGHHYRGNLNRKTTESFIERSKQIHNDFYNYNKTTYVNISNKIIITCPTHGDFKQTPLNHLNGHGCPGCHNCKRPNTAEFIENARRVHSNKFSYDKVNYVKAHSKIIITCPTHGDFEQKPNSHLNGDGCPICKTSKGEKIISYFLHKNNIQYKQQYRIKECRNKLPLPFDFAIFNKNTVLIGLVEFQGEQHYFESAFGSKARPIKNKFQQIKNNDLIKQKYCKENNIPLLIIPYWNKDIIENKLQLFLEIHK